MFFPSFLPAGGLKYANMASFQAITPWSAPCGEAEGSPALHCGRCQPQPRTTLRIYSGKLVYAAEWMRKRKIFLREEEAEKRSRKKSSLKGGGRKSHDEKDGDRSSLRHGSVSDGVSSQCALGSAVLSSPDSFCPPPAPAWRPASVSWLHHPAPMNTQSASENTEVNSDAQSVTGNTAVITFKSSNLVTY